MEITILGRNMELSDPLRRAVEEKVGRLGRFLDGMDRAEVKLSEERNPRIAERERCEVTMAGHGHTVRVHAAASDPLAALDRAVGKLEHRLERLKGRLVGRSHPRRAEAKGRSNGRAEVGEADEDGSIDAVGEGRIVRTKRFDMKPMIPDEAVLQMEQLSHDFFFFTNAETGQPTVVYHRRHGGIGLIEGQ